MNNARTILSVLILLLSASLANAQQQGRGTYALVNARIETITSGTIERGTVVIRNGRIAAVGAGVTAPADATTIDCSGLTIYPGLIDAGCQIGLVEIGSLPETVDQDELGEISPQADALTAVNPNSIAIPVTRVSGVTTAMVVPVGGLVAGTGALINLHGYTPEQMKVGSLRPVVLNFPSTGRAGWSDTRSDEEIEKEVRKGVDRLKELWKRAVLYAKIDSAYRAHPDPERLPEYIPELKALLPVIRGEAPLMIEVNTARDIDSAIVWVREQKIRAIFTGVSEGWRVADRIAAAKIPCIVGPVISMPTRPGDNYARTYQNPGLLHAAGVVVTIRTTDAANVRNLPFNAGFAAAYGLGREEALRAVTIVPATLFGVDSLLGSIETGKQATLFVADGDPFEPATTIRHLFIDGYQIGLETRQTELYREFIRRSP
jgi:imidazolonepropionase-like amidohydrolase